MRGARLLGTQGAARLPEYARDLAGTERGRLETLADLAWCGPSLATPIERIQKPHEAGGSPPLSPSSWRFRTLLLD